MLTSVIVALLAIVLLFFLLIYKKEMLSKMFTLNMSAPANEFTQQLEQTADSIIKRLEEEATQLELLLEEAEIKIGMLSQQVEHANKIIEQLVEVRGDREDSVQSEIQVDAAGSNKVIGAKAVDEAYDEAVQPNELSIYPDESNCTVNESVNIDKYRHIIVMADQGYTVTEIAKATGMGRGEITLLLQLNKK